MGFVAKTLDTCKVLAITVALTFPIDSIDIERTIRQK